MTHRAYATNELPLWNPYQGAGAPHAANMQSAVFDPLLLAVDLHPSPLTWDLSIVGAFILGAAATYAFGLVLGLAVVPAVVASAAFSLSGWFFLYSNNQFSRSYIFLPLLFLLVERVLRSRSSWPVFGLAVAVVGNVLVGMPEASFLVISTTWAYAAVRLVQERKAVPIGTSLARVGGGSLLGFLLAAPVLLLFLQYESLSFNVHKPELGRGLEADPVWDILDWLGPFFPGLSEATPRGWFGIAVVVSTLVAVSGRTETKRLHAWFFLVVGVAVLVKIYDFGVLEWVGALPLARFVIFPIFAAPVGSFVFAVLAGIGVQVLWSRDLRLRRFLLLAGLGLLVLVGVLSAGDRLPLIVEDRQTVWARTAAFALLAIAAVLLASWIGARWGAATLACVVVLELLWLAPSDIYAKRADPYLAPGWMTFVRAAQKGDANSRVFGLDSKLYPNTAGALGLQDIRALDALYVARYWRYVKSFIQPYAFDRFTGSEVSPTQFERNPMFDALGVRAVLSRRNLGTAQGLRLLGRDGDTRVYENINAYPRAWVVHDVHVVDDEDAAFEYLEAHSRRRHGAFIVDAFDPRREAVVENRGETLRELRTCAPGATDRATIERYSARSVTIRTTAACAGLLVLPDTYFPGWTATVDGRKTAIHPTDGAFRGVVVPKGTSKVVFRYEPQAFRFGVAVAAVGLAAFGLVALVTWRRRREREGSVRAEPVGSGT